MRKPGGGVIAGRSLFHQCLCEAHGPKHINTLMTGGYRGLPQMDSYYAILMDFTKEVKHACKRAVKSDDPDALDVLLDALDVSLGKVKERHNPGKKKKGGSNAKKKSK